MNTELNAAAHARRNPLQQVISVVMLALAAPALALAAIVWLLIDLDVLAADSGSAIAWISLVCLAALLAIGLSWAHIWRRLTGQVELADDD